MSHFTVGVFLKDGMKLEDALAPYQENNMDDCPKQYLKFNDVTEECQSDYDNGSSKMVRLADGTLVCPWDERFRKPGAIGHGSDTHEVTEGEKVNIPHRYHYGTLEQFIEDYCGYRKDEELGKYGYWENPNAKWDWYVTGGRWGGLLLTRDGRKVDSAKLKDIDWAKMREEAEQEAKKIWDESPKDSLERYFSGIHKDDTRESYVTRKSNFEVYAVITPDGSWHEKGEMGWFGMSSATEEDEVQWVESFHDRFIKDADPELTLVIVDCHI